MNYNNYFFNIYQLEMWMYFFFPKLRSRLSNVDIIFPCLKKKKESWQSGFMRRRILKKNLSPVQEAKKAPLLFFFFSEKQLSERCTIGGVDPGVGVWTILSVRAKCIIHFSAWFSVSHKPSQNLYPRPRMREISDYMHSIVFLSLLGVIV